MDLYKTIGHQIKKTRKEQGIGQKNLASKLGYTPSAISQYENGKRCILLTDLEKIAAILHRPITFFLESLNQKKKKGVYVSLNKYKLITEADKMKNKFKLLERQIENKEKETKNLENKVQNLMARISEQSKITNQTAMLYNEIKRNEKKTRNAEVLASSCNTAKNIAYQLNNPLTALLGNTQILISETNSKSSKYKDYKKLEDIIKICIKTLTNLLNSFTPSSK